jgi:diketogulonate reductase-like aldo/keto reductase
MKILATRIANELRKAKHCAVYEPELTQVWPNSETRQAEIALFAKKHGWRLRHYSHGFCAIFDQEPSLKSVRL